MLYIAATVENAGHTVKILDLGFSKNYIRELSETIEEFSPDVLGLSLRNIAECIELTFVYELYRKLVEVAKSVPMIVLGGAGFSIVHEELLSYTGAHCGIVGEGEKEFVNLLNAFEHGELFDDINNITKKIWKAGKLEKFNEVNTMAVRYKHWQKYGKFYSVAGSAIPIQASRGCEKGCIYCSYPVIQGNLLRHRHINDVLDEFKSVSEMPGVREVFFVDSVFNADVNYIRKLVSAIIEKSGESKFVRWRCCLSPIGMDVRLAYMLNKAGCIGCDLGIDSLSNNVLSSLNKGYTSYQAIEAAHALERNNIPYNIGLIFGSPDETEETIEETLENVKKLKPSSINAFIGVRIYPETPLERKISFSRKAEKPVCSYMWPNQFSFLLEDKVKIKLRELISNAPNKWHFSNASILEE